MNSTRVLKFEDDEGNAYTIFFEEKDTFSDSGEIVYESEDDEYETYGISDSLKVKLKDIHSTIQAYAWYAIGAFRNVPFAEITEMNLKFGIKIAGKTGVPVLTEGAAEGNFQIEVKCKPRK